MRTGGVLVDPYCYRCGGPVVHTESVLRVRVYGLALAMETLVYTHTRCVADCTAT